jgi:hypothetical protein
VVSAARRVNHGRSGTAHREVHRAPPGRTGFTGDPRYPTVSEERRLDLLAVKAELEDEAPHDAQRDPYAVAHKKKHKD